MRSEAVLPLAVALAASCCGDDEAGKCKGTPTACTEISDAYACGAQRGCTQVEVCRGDLRPCSEYGASAFECEGAGCFWNGECSGTEASGPFAGESCVFLSSSLEGCAGQEGCTFSGGCDTGSRYTWCGQITNMQLCAAAPYADCHPDLGCGGDPLPCDALPTETLCAAHAGCSWTP